MKLPRHKLAVEISRRLDSGEPKERIAREVAALLIENGQTSELNSLLRDVQEYRAQQNGIVEVNAESAYELGNEQRKNIEDAIRIQYPQTKKVIIHHQLNPHVVGGLSLSFANAKLDLTIRAKLNKLRTLTA